MDEQKIAEASKRAQVAIGMVRDLSGLLAASADPASRNMSTAIVAIIGIRESAKIIAEEMAVLYGMAEGSYVTDADPTGIVETEQYTVKSFHEMFDRAASAYQ